jgi:uncharacterized protein YjbI with pentapeptide repeats
MSNTFSQILKHLLPFMGWLAGIYIALFVVCFYAHVNESNIIANRADAIITEITHNKSSLVKVSSVQNMVRKTKPSFLEPSTIYNSLFGKREIYKIINEMLGDAIKNHKDELAGLDLGQVDIEDADFSEADLHGINLRKANLSGAKLRGANLIGAKLNLANFYRAIFVNAYVFKADFSDAILIGADLEHTVGLTCDQIKSAIINENTHLPDYISLTESSEAGFKCTNLLKGEVLDLGGVNLDNAQLHSANLSKYNFRRASLMSAMLASAKLNNANFSNANLRGAYLGNANFTGTDLGELILGVLFLKAL